MATTTTLANDIGVIVDSDLIQGFFRNDEFFSLFPIEQAAPDTAHRWPILTAGLTGTLKAEGDAFSAAQSTTNSRAVLGYHTHDSVISITDDLRAALGPNNSNSYWQSLAVEVLQSRKAVQQAIMTRWLGSTAGTDGIQLAVDSTGTYASLDHAAITGWASQETAVNAAQSYAALDDMVETLRDDPVRSRPSLILMPENQVTNYTRLSGPGVRNTFTLQAPGGGPQNFDVGPQRGAILAPAQSFNGIPIVGVAELTDTVILFLNMTDCRCCIRYRVFGLGDAGGWQAEEVPRGGRTTQIALSWTGHFCVPAPRYCGKLTGVTA